jgi:hypothetical protein
MAKYLALSSVLRGRRAVLHGEDIPFYVIAMHWLVVRAAADPALARRALTSAPMGCAASCAGYDERFLDNGKRWHADTAAARHAHEPASTAALHDDSAACDRGANTHARSRNSLRTR